jgi:hypothetical protein
VVLGAEALLGSKSTQADVADTLRPLDRDTVIRHCTRMLNTLAFDRGLRDDQADVIHWLPPDAALLASRSSLTSFHRRPTVPT